MVSDFDNVAFHVSTPESKTKILISISLKCFRELLDYGAQEVLEREYGPYIVSPEDGYDFSVLVDLEKLPAEAGKSGDVKKWSRSGTEEMIHRCTRRPDPSHLPPQA